jgi:hypothetical protein
MQKMPAPLRFIPPIDCLDAEADSEKELLWHYERKLLRSHGPLHIT